jgi:hypothetical protein
MGESLMSGCRARGLASDTDPQTRESS